MYTCKSRYAFGYQKRRTLGFSANNPREYRFFFCVFCARISVCSLGLVCGCNHGRKFSILNNLSFWSTRLWLFSFGYCFFVLSCFYVCSCLFLIRRLSLIQRCFSSDLRVEFNCLPLLCVLYVFPPNRIVCWPLLCVLCVLPPTWELNSMVCRFYVCYMFFLRLLRELNSIVGRFYVVLNFLLNALLFVGRFYVCCVEFNCRPLLCVLYVFPPTIMLYYLLHALLFVNYF